MGYDFVMAAKDLYHTQVRNALIKDGWTITDDPLSLRYGNRNFSVDLGAERLLAAEKGTQKIAVEIKTFSRYSQVEALENAIGQYIVYRDLLDVLDAERILFLAVPSYTEAEIFSEAIGQLIVEKMK